MQVVVTGGGTGGHVYPALEVARLAQEESDLLYMGSLRGMEKDSCESRGIKFEGFNSGPVYSVASISGIISLANLFRASLIAKKSLKRVRPDVVFSTGGYSSAPVMRAAKTLGIPLAIHACDTVPGRSLRMFSDYAKVVTATFEETKAVLGREVIRTGHPIRNELREHLRSRSPESAFVVVLGGSGGAKFLNEVVPQAAKLIPDVKFLHSAGKKQFDTYKYSADGLNGYEMVPYLDSERLMHAYRTATLVIARSGAGICEYAMARIPSILIPLPSSADDHQFHNALEFASIGGSSILTQDVRSSHKQANAESLAEEIKVWISDEARMQTAGVALSKWDRPNATLDIWQAVKRVGQKQRHA